jgi:acylphosphatase
MNKRLHAMVEGRVQGVGFRNFVELQALSLDLTGWVRNLYSGEVEVIAEGPESALEFFLRDLESGPSHAHVQKVNAEWSKSQEEFSSFDIRSTWISD